MYQPRRQLSQMHIMNNTRFNKGKGDLLQKLRPIRGGGRTASPTLPPHRLHHWSQIFHPNHVTIILLHMQYLKHV